MYKISKTLITKHKKLEDQLRKIDAEIEKRIGYIAKTICKITKQKFSAWETHNSEPIRISDEFMPDHIVIYIITKNFTDKNKTPVYEVFTDDIEFSGYSCTFPIRWLYSDFEKEFKELYQKAKEEAELQVVQNQNTIKKALTKLSKEEKKALGL